MSLRCELYYYGFFMTSENKGTIHIPYTLYITRLDTLYLYQSQYLPLMISHLATHINRKNIAESKKEKAHNYDNSDNVSKYTHHFYG